MSKVVIDVRANHRTGVARYGVGLLTGLAQRPVDHQDLDLLVVADADQEADVRAALGDAAPKVEIAPEREGFVRNSPWLRRVLESCEADLYYSVHYTVDRACPVPFVCTVHDLTRLRFPETAYTAAAFAEEFGVPEWEALRSELDALSGFDTGEGSEFERYFRALNLWQAAHARAFTTVSEATRGDMVRLLGVPAEHVDVVPCGVDTALFRPRGARSQAVPYCMFVGLAGPTKRFGWLLETWLTGAGARGGAELVVVGGFAEQRPEVLALLAKHPRAATSVRFVGRVPDDELARLYSGASALLVASVNEGNHLGPLEALACGCEVICTDIPPLRETVDGFAHFYPVADRTALDGLVGRALTGELPSKASTFQPQQWSDSAALLLDVLRRAAARPHQAEGDRTRRADHPGLVIGDPVGIRGTATPLPES